MPVQAKLAIGRSGDKYEQEADQVGNQVVQQIDTPQHQLLNRKLNHVVQQKSEIMDVPKAPGAANKVSIHLLSNPGTSLVQRERDTLTGVKMEPAQKIYKNYLKGDPPFKPQHGNFGKVSWFKGTGNPYIGGQAQQYNVIIDVKIPDPPKLDNWFNEVLKDWDPDRTRRKDRNQHGDFWRTLGNSLDGQGLAEVSIPQGPLSVQGAGTFITADSGARQEVKLCNPEKLAMDIGESSASIGAEVEGQGADRGADTKAPSFSVTLDRVGSTVKQENIEDSLNEVVERPTSYSMTRNQNPQTMAERVVGKTSDTVRLTLTYEKYLQARKNAKKLSTTKAKLEKYGNVTIGKGANWKDTAIRSYTQKY